MFLIEGIIVSQITVGGGVADGSSQARNQTSPQHWPEPQQWHQILSLLHQEETPKLPF